jgi:hypothetical protein
MLLVVLALLKEQPLFWRNTGGWPIWLRELVEAAFYLLLTLEAVCLVGFSIMLVARSVPGHSSGSAVALCLGLLWVPFLTIIGIVVANNVENVITGRPLHWHPI